MRAIAPAALLFAACSDGRSPLNLVEPRPAPLITAASVVPNPRNVLSAVVMVRVEEADSVAVRFHLGAAPAGSDSTTPALPTPANAAAIPLLGLLPASRYVLRAIAFGPGGTAAGEAIGFTTDTVPPDLPRYAASGSAPSPGYVVFAAGRYGLVIDNSGRVVWYHRFPSGPGLNFQALPTGRYAARPTPPTLGGPAPWLEVDPLGVVTRSLNCARGLVPRFHDLIADADGAYWLMCDETRAMDLSALGGVADAQVTGTVVQRLSSDGELLFEWSPFEHFEITDLPAAERSGPAVNWTHGNALDLDAAGNLLVSFRSLSEITKIDARSGAVVWRMGGLRNQFTFLGTALPPFLRQHGLRVTASGELQLLDNLGDPAASRAERYVYDERLRIAGLVASYASSPGVTAQLGGTTQSLPGGRVLVAYGNGARVEEYDASGTVVWRIEGNPGYIFRAQRISSLYQPGVGSRR